MLSIVHTTGLEPARPKTRAPQARASTNSAMCAFNKKMWCEGKTYIKVLQTILEILFF